MDTTIIAPYTKALEAQKAEYAGYIADGVKGIALPATKEAIPTGKKNFLTDSGWVFLVIGVAGFIAGLIVGVSGIWIAGCIAIASGVYCLIKGKQQLTAEAFRNLGNEVYGKLEGIIAHVSGGWTKNVEDENASLRKAIVSSAATPDAKVAALGEMADDDYLHVDTAELRKEIDDVAAQESLEAFTTYLPKAAATLTESLTEAAKARTAALTALSK